ncbi:MAG: epimerase [Terracidiphilus sp.]
MEIVPALSSRTLRVVLPGGSGQIGQFLARHFQERGHHVTVLTRGPYAAPWQTVHWDGKESGDWVETLEGADVCINLSGRSVNCRYHADHRAAIYNSRIRTTQLLNQEIASLANPPRVWLNASAASIYTRALDVNKVDLPLDEAADKLACNKPPEKSEPSMERWVRRKDFISRVANDWETAFFGSSTPRTRKIALRSGIVLSPAPGSVFAVLSNLVRLGLGGTQGSGRQFVSWIHEADFARTVEFLIDHEEINGPVNMVAPNPLTNREFMAALRWAWDVPNGLPAPSLSIKFGAFFLRTEPELVLQSSRVVPRRLLNAGFDFEFPQWSEAAENLVRQWKERE